MPFPVIYVYGTIHFIDAPRFLRTEVEMTFHRVSTGFFFLVCIFIPLCLISGVAAAEPEVYFAHFADGAGYSTSWHFTGYGFGTSSIDVEIIDKNGALLPLATDHGTNSTFRLSLNDYGSISLRTLGGNGPLKTGWVRVTSSPAVGAMETIEAIGSDGVTGKASVLSSRALYSTTLLVPDPSSTAIAVSTSPANSLSFRLLDSNGNVIGTSLNYPLPVNNQIALFVNQIPGFEKLNVSDGSLELSGSSPFSVTTLLFDGQRFTTAPVLSGRFEPANARNVLLNQFTSAIQESRDIGDQLLPPSDADLTTYASFLSQPQTGLIRLLPRETYDGYLSVQGGGAYYSFARQTHEYGYGSDVSLEQGYLSVGFAGFDFGFMTNLGDVPIEGVTLDTPAIQYLASFNAPTASSDAQAQGQRASAGFSVGGFNYIDRLKATSPTTFAVRSICYNNSDVLAAFRVTRIDTDGSAILVWKILKAFAVPKL